MTYARANSLDANKNGIGVAVDAQFPDLEYMPAGFAFFPKLVARTAEENNFTAALSFGERNRVHEAEHEDVTGPVVLNNGGNEAACLVEVDVYAAHAMFLLNPICSDPKTLYKNKKPAGACCASGLKSALSIESLCTPQWTRLVAVVMMAMRPVCECAIHCEDKK